MTKNVPLMSQAEYQQWLKNYLVLPARPATVWHPTVLEEMAMKEFAANRIKPKQQDQTMSSISYPEMITSMAEMDSGWQPEQFVPLAPMQTRYHSDEPHQTLKGPKFFQPVPEPSEPSELYLG